MYSCLEESILNAKAQDKLVNDNKLLLASLMSMVDMFERHIEGREGPDDAAQRWDNAREAIKQATTN